MQILIKDLFGSDRFAQTYKPNGKQRGSERGSILQDISEKTGYPIGRLAARLQGMNTDDLYFILSSMNDLVATKKKSSFRHAFNSVMFVPKT